MDAQLAIRRKSLAVQQRQRPECEGVTCSFGDDFPRYLCLNCGCTYCDACWNIQAPHKHGKVGLDGLPHEKTNHDTYDRLKAIFEPPEDNEVLKKLHIDDEETMWFGIEKDDSGRCFFEDNGRFSALLSKYKQPGSGDRYPLLVSFVGQTGAGKSTLIKMLVSMMEQKLVLGSKSTFDSPVAGSVKNDKSPTSGDVHLYIDPATALLQYPVLYADCEGLEGGEVPPRAAQIRQALRKKGWLSGESLFSTRPREVRLPVGKSEAGTREWAVKHIYPRLLYTFSDAVVFVLRNTRTFESTALTLLLEWAATSLESSVNQPILPHAIIVLNASSATIDKEEWDPNTATEKLMDHVKNAVFDVPQFQKYADTWKRRGQKIEATLDLIKCYYADIRVVRIPTKGRYMLASEQINALHREITKACDTSFKGKVEAHLISNTDQLNKYLQAGFDHFTTRPDEPFNFISAAFKSNPIPKDFGDHILNVAMELFEIASLSLLPPDGTEIFEKLSYIVAACISIDCIRHRRPGKPGELFDQYYAGSCAAAWNRFCDFLLSCSFVSRKGKRCVNTMSNHEKGHQSEKGKIIGVGGFQSAPITATFSATWLEMIRQTLTKNNAQLQEKLLANRHPSWNETASAYDLHQERLSYFYSPHEKIIRGLYTCYACLMEVPQHPLPCGHFLCTACLKAFGRTSDKNTVTLDYCPLHNTLTKLQVPCTIRFKPEFAGVRVLSLDGGGMRGIVELEILRAIEKALGGALPIQAFFDLIVGTSTGGLIALGLGAKEWSLDQCFTQFVGLCNQAFTDREFAGIAGLRQITTIHHKSKYKTRPLREALRKALGEEYLYGAVRATSSMYDLKVAVTATSGTGEEGLLIGNYNRQPETEYSYRFLNDHDLQVWQAASATTAAPRYFKPFDVDLIDGSKETFFDGAIYFNNPVRIANTERRFLWPDVADSHPDIVLSLGTGKNGRMIDAELRKEIFSDGNLGYPYPGYRDAYSTQGRLSKLKNRVSRKVTKTKPAGLVSRYFEVMVNRLDNILDAEREFDDFFAENAFFYPSEVKDRYIRLNVDLDCEPPTLDEKAKLPDLQQKAQAILRTPNYQLLITTVARQLISSVFYFDKSDRIEEDERTHAYTVTGRIACRFEGSTNEMQTRLRNLGDFLRLQRSADFQQYFTVKEEVDGIDDNKVEITVQAIDYMTKSADFRLADNLSIKVPNKVIPTTIFLAFRSMRGGEPELFPISGFPRALVTEDSVTAKRLSQRAEVIRANRYNTSLIASDLMMEDYMNALENGEYPDLPGLPPLPHFPPIPPFDDDDATLISGYGRDRLSPSLRSPSSSLMNLDSDNGLTLRKSPPNLSRATSSAHYSPLQALDDFENQNERYKKSTRYSIGKGRPKPNKSPGASATDLRPPSSARHRSKDSGIGVDINVDISPPIEPHAENGSMSPRSQQRLDREVSGASAASIPAPIKDERKLSSPPMSPPPVPNMMIVDAEELFERPRDGRSSSHEDYVKVPRPRPVSPMVAAVQDDNDDSDGPPSDYQSM